MTERHIVAMGGGQDVGDPVFRYAADLVDRPRPKVCLVPTAASAVPISVMRFLSVFPADAFEPTYLDLFDRDDRDLRDFVCSQDLIFVGGGNTANLLAVWRVHGLDDILREAWESGVVLAGLSAGANCWFEASTTAGWQLLSAIFRTSPADARSTTAWSATGSRRGPPATIERRRTTSGRSSRAS